MKTCPRYTHGFSLIELLVTIMIIAILAAVAIPNYRQYVLRGHRTEATRALQDLAAREESYYFTNNAYTNSLATLGSNASAAGSFFSIGLASASSVEYSLTATAQGTQLQDKGCTKFTLSRAGVMGSEGTEMPATCWGQ
jgi:type IV pilus assembly protein PilE